MTEETVSPEGISVAVALGVVALFAIIFPFFYLYTQGRLNKKSVNRIDMKKRKSNTLKMKKI